MAFEQFKLSSVNASSLLDQCLEQFKLSNVNEVERKSVVYPCRGFVTTDGKTEKKRYIFDPTSFSLDNCVIIWCKAK